MRTLDPILETALASGNYEPYIVAIIDNSTTLDQIVEYELTRTTLKLKAISSLASGDYFNIVLRRGISLDGINYYIDTSNLSIVKYKLDGAYFSIEAELLPPLFVTTAADTDYTTVLDEFAAQINKTAIRKSPSNALWNNIFFPTGKSLTLNKSKQIESLLKQKAFMAISDNGNDEILFYFHKLFFDGIEYTITTKQLVEQIFAGGDHLFFSILWRDEVGTIHKNATGPYYNIGYLETTDVKPTEVSNTGQMPQLIKPIKLPINLTYQSGDVVKIDSTYGSGYAEGLLEVKEYFDLKQTPPWGVEVSLWDYVGSNEGGSLPATIERAAPYTPLNTSTFNNNLNSTTNNLQALAEAVDDLNLGGTAPTTTAANDFQVGDGSGNWITKTLAQTITILRTSLDSIYAAISHTHAADEITSLRFLYAFASYINISPLTATNSYPFSATLPSYSTFPKQYSQAIYISTGTNNSSNYWKIDLMDAGTGTAIATVTTQGLTANAGYTLVDSTMAISELTQSTHKYIYVLATKIGTPTVSLYVHCPSVEYELS